MTAKQSINPLFLIAILFASCVKPPIIPPPEPPPTICTDSISLALSIHLTDQDYLSHIEVEIGTENINHLSGTIINAVDGSEHTYVDTLVLDGPGIKQADTIFVRYKIFDWQDGSFYFAKPDTLIK